MSACDAGDLAVMFTDETDLHAHHACPGADAMALLEDRSAAFILRVWCEPDRSPRRSPIWRGSIEHVPSGRRVFFDHSGAIVAFVQPYIDSLLDGEAPPAR